MRYKITRICKKHVSYGNSMTNKTFAASSLAAQAMGWIDPVTKAVVPPIHMASTYLRDEDNGYSSGRIYARSDNPTFDQAEATLAALEGGAKALVFSSGMSAATTCFLALAPGDHVVAPKVMYWSLRNWLAGFAQHWGLKVDFVDADRTDAIAAAVKPGSTKLVWIETPANPTWCVTDIAAAADIAHRAGALLGVDSTVGTPVLCEARQPVAQRPVHHLGRHDVITRRQRQEAGRRRTHARGEDQRLGATFEGGQGRLGLVECRIVRARIDPAGAVAVVLVALIGAGHMDRRHHGFRHRVDPVSYTHLTLPTIYSV